ncbi:MAG: fused MFS/spermidine synthase [Nitrospirota bacterium]
MAVVWSVTVFLSAFLLFLVQPMMAKMILPMLGGTPAVWNTCMLFYQATLLAGYGYVHLLSSRVAPRRQLLVHLGLLAAPLLLLPIGLPTGWTPPDETNPVLWVLLLLTVAIGLPFFVLSTTAPLLQKWFSWTDHRSATDPYFLYAASNAGSMLGLLGYPLLIEPWLPLRGTQRLTQTMLWSFGYGVLVVLIGACAWFVRHAQKSRGTKAALGLDQPAVAPLSPLQTSTLVRWVVLAFIPSSLLLGATTHVTLNVAAIPLLWVVPLALYLLSFIIVFAKWPAANHRAMVIALPLILLLMAFDVMPAAPSLPYWMELFLPLVGLGVVAMVCHGELARTRPSTDRLTLFYLLMSVGGALGGVFNALIAPVVFTDIYEYEIVMVLACFILPPLEDRDSLWTARWSPYRWSVGKRQTRDWAWVLGVAIVTGFSIWFIRPLEDPAFLLAMICTGVPLFLCYASVGRPFRLGLSLAVVLVMANAVSAWFGDPVLYQTRTFFGVLKVKYTKENNTRKLLHGTTNHGIQRMEPEARRESVSYFHPTGPYGQVFAAFSGPNAKKKIAVTGLGIAALVNYCEQGQSLTYYEIDPAVVTIAQDPKLFTYYNDAQARGVDLRVVVGDARLKMLEAPDSAYDMIILDAFTSDAIPVHLLTREAMEMYLQKLAPGGLLVAHISNRYLALEPVLGNLAQTLGLVALKQFDFANGVPFKSGADLVVMARQREALGPLATDPRWTPVNKVLSVGTWSDDFSNVVSIITWSN